jgi:hypothetical protein
MPRIQEIIITLFALGYFLIDLNFPIHQWVNEGAVLVGAMQIRAGLLPYRDFASYNSPGIYYLLLLMPSVSSARFWLVAIPKTLIVMLVYRIAEDIDGMPLVSAIFCTLALGTATFTGSDFSGIHPTVIASLLALAAWRWKSWWLVALTCLFRYDVGLYAAGAVWLA